MSNVPALDPYIAGEVPMLTKPGALRLFTPVCGRGMPTRHQFSACRRQDHGPECAVLETHEGFGSISGHGRGCHPAGRRRGELMVISPATELRWVCFWPKCEATTTRSLISEWFPICAEHERVVEVATRDGVYCAT